MRKYYIFYGIVPIEISNASKEFDDEQEAIDYIEDWHEREPEVELSLWEYGYKGRRKEIISY